MQHRQIGGDAGVLPVVAHHQIQGEYGHTTFPVNHLRGGIGPVEMCIRDSRAGVLTLLVHPIQFGTVFRGLRYGLETPFRAGAGKGSGL